MVSVILMRNGSGGWEGIDSPVDGLYDPKFSTFFTSWMTDGIVQRNSIMIMFIQ